MFNHSYFQTFLPGQRQFKPPISIHIGHRDTPAEDLNETGHPNRVLAAQHDPDPHNHLVGVIVVHFQIEATRFGAGDVQSGCLETVFDLLDVVNLIKIKMLTLLSDFIVFYHYQQS